MSKLRTRSQIANASVDILDTEFFRALCEPARVQIFRQLILQGRSDVGSIAANLPQDRSVIARHLQQMERAGLLRSETDGRHTFYEIDGPAIVSRVDGIAALVRAMVPLCCEPSKR
ncbi:MAG: metalloregulator ArsR/SmtB family transcription factor [Arenimonas sp.]|jgi:DNA-binding transcriptional ArsR family regulator